MSSRGPYKPKMKDLFENTPDLSSVNKLRRRLGLPEYVLHDRKCLKCDKVFKGIKGKDFICPNHSNNTFDGLNWHGGTGRDRR